MWSHGKDVVSSTETTVAEGHVRGRCEEERSQRQLWPEARSGRVGTESSVESHNFEAPDEDTLTLLYCSCLTNSRLVFFFGMKRIVSFSNPRFVGRADDLIKVGGVWVDMHEVEHQLAAMDDVEEATICGRSAYVVLRAIHDGRIATIRGVLPSDFSSSALYPRNTQRFDFTVDS